MEPSIFAYPGQTRSSITPFVIHDKNSPFRYDWTYVKWILRSKYLSKGEKVIFLLEGFNNCGSTVDYVALSNMGSLIFFDSFSAKKDVTIIPFNVRITWGDIGGIGDMLVKNAIDTAAPVIPLWVSTLSHLLIRIKRNKGLQQIAYLCYN